MWCFLLSGLLLPGGGERDSSPLDGWPLPEPALVGLAAPTDGPLALGVLVRTFFTRSPEEASDDGSITSGVIFEDVDLHATYRQGGFDLRVSADFDRENGRLEDAYARLSGWPGLALTMGQFKPRVVRSGSIPDSELLFRERTFLGAAFDGWDDGLELGGHYDQFDYWLTLTDGSNGSDTDHFLSARGEWALYDAAWDDIEGARGAPNHLRALLGATFFADAAQSNSSGDGYGFDLALTFGPYSFHAEWADLDQEFARTIDVFNGHEIELGDGQPRSFTFGRRVGAGGEAAVRFQMADDPDSTEAFGVSAGWSPAGASARLVADLELVEGDTRDFSLFSLGVQLGSSGQSRPFLGASGTH